MNRVLIFLWFIGQSFSLAAQNEKSDITVSILTCAPGHDIYTIYGHNAIRIVDNTAGTDLVYNYGTFDFKTKGFIIKFMRGKLPYTLDVATYNRFIAEYDYFQRDVTEQVLSLDSLQKQKVVKYLEVNMQPENRTYKYDFFMDNCATRLRDIIDHNITGFTWDTTRASNKTFRQIIKEYQNRMPWTNFGIDLIIGAPADQKTTLSQETFIPDYLAEAIQFAKYADPKQNGLQLKENKILGFDLPNSNPNFLLSPYFLFLLLLLIEINIFFRHLRGISTHWIKKYDQFWLIVLTLASVLMLFMWFGTDHIPTKYNWNILWASPLITLWWWKKETSPWLSYIIAFGLVITIINAIPGIQILPQYFHPIVGIISLILILKGRRLYFSGDQVLA